MATKWVTELECQWCGEFARVGIEKDGLGNTYRMICDACGIMEQTAFHFPAGEKTTKLIKEGEDKIEDLRARFLR